MKATDLLKQQHRLVEQLFAKIEKLDDDDETECDRLCRELAMNLAAHMTIEQEIFYPAVRRVDDDTVEEAYEEHAIAEVALKRLMVAEEKTFDARLKALKELIEHHVGEEEDELFPEVEKKIGDELERLGTQMQRLFAETMAKKTMPKGMILTSADTARGAPNGRGVATIRGTRAATTSAPRRAAAKRRTTKTTKAGKRKRTVKPRRRSR